MILTKLRPSSKVLFLVDGLGALLTASCLLICAGSFNTYIGLYPQILRNLSLIAIFFAGYSLACYSFLKEGHQIFLRIIAVANLLYCCLTAGLILRYYSSLTWLGLGYFIVEVVVVIALSCLELIVSMQSS